MTTTQRPDELVSILSSDFQRALGFVIIEDRKTSGTSGGTFTSGAWRTRTLNTTVLNTLENDYSLAANQFTLAKGVYWILASAPGFVVERHATRLQNITDGTTVASGTSEFTNDNSPVSVSNRSIVNTFFVLSSSKTLELQHRCQTTKASDGFGLSMGGSFAVTNEVYAQVMICKIG